MDNTTQRRIRIDKIFHYIASNKAINKEKLISYCSVNFGLSRRTTREYLNDLTNLQFIREEDGDIIGIKKLKKRKNAGEEFEKMFM